MENPLAYTYDALERELNLLEIHFKEAPKGDEDFCADCINKHIQTIRGLALEGPGFTESKTEQNKFLTIEKEIRNIKDKNYRKYGIEFAQKIRQLRKSLSICKECTLSKDLNNYDTFNNRTQYTHSSYLRSKSTQLNGDLDDMAKMDFKPVIGIGAGQVAAEGVRYVVDTFQPTWKTAVQLGGGVGAIVLPMFLKMPKMVKDVLMVAGTNMVANELANMIKGAITPSASARANGMARASNNSNGNGVGGYGGKNFSYAPSFGGPTFAGKVTASNIPSRYARAGILSGAQNFEAPEHADLIRVD